jgi:hypothetical protein
LTVPEVIIEICKNTKGEPILWQQVASRGVASNGGRTRNEHRQDDPEYQDHQQRSNQDKPGLRVTEIQSPTETVALFDKQGWVIGIVVKEPSIPVAIVIVENDVSTLTISRCARFCTGALRMPK